MRRTTWLLIGVVFVVVAIAARYDLSAAAQPTVQTYTMNWWTVDGGGATFSTGGGYSLGGTAGQPDAGVLSGGSYALRGGFWQPGTYTIYLPLLMRP